MLGQTFAIHDLATVALLIVLEGVLSLDNALVLGLLARRLPHEQQKHALTYGLIGAFIFRFFAIAVASFLLHWDFVKLLGGAYLVYVAVKHFFFNREKGDDDPETNQELKVRNTSAFWPTVFVIEMTDIAFAVDSIVAAFGVVGDVPPGAYRHPKLWVVLTGGFIGVVLMRFAAVLFIRLLERFPRFEIAAYLLVLVIGIKLVLDWGLDIDFHNARDAAFWIFWLIMLACFCVGFIPQKQSKATTT